MSRVLVFGTFDLFHPGHEFFLSRAATLGDELHVAVARDSHVRLLKNHEPSRGEEQRLATVARFPGVFAAHLSDEDLGAYRIVRDVKPNVIALGHDQTELGKDLERWIAETGWPVTVVRLPEK